MRALLLIAAAAGCAFAQQPGWWMTQPIRWLQLNLRETDAALDPQQVISQVVDFQANVVHLGMGGITAYYPTKVQYHYPSPYMPAGQDTFGELLRLAHARGIKVVGRFDLSKTKKEVYDAHPEWFFRKADGNPVIYNGLYSVCINGGYYRQKGMEILSEALEKYDVDGLFFNMFGNQSRDYSGNYVGDCHCENCKRLYRQYYGKELPEKADEQYRQFMFRSSREVAAEIGKLIRAKRPKAGYFNYIQEYTDGIMSESNTAVRRPLPLWPYNSSDNVNRARNSQPGKMSVNLCMQFLDFPWRFQTNPVHEHPLRLWQNVAHGGALAFAVNGTLAHEDRQAIEAARPVFAWLAANEQYYVGQQSAARVILLGGAPGSGRTYNTSAYRGLFRFLTEEHIPFAVTDNTDWIGKRPVDLVLASDWAPAQLNSYLEQGGRALVVSPRPPELPVPPVIATHKDQQTYFRVRNRDLFPSLKLTNLIMLEGDYTEVAGDGAQSISYVPPSMFGPPEKIHVDMKDSSKPGIVMTGVGKGKLIWVPWDLGASYYRYSLTTHAGLLRDLVNALLAQRQIETNAHPLLEMSLMRQGKRTLLHLVNVSGHSQTGYFAPVPMNDVRVKLQGSYASARALRAGHALTLTKGSELVIPRVGDYEVIVLE
jgi:hypothetical protein